MLNYQKTDLGKQPKLPSEDSPQESAIAFLHCYDLIEDFAKTLGLPLENFCQEWCSNWMFGYAKALQPFGIRTVMFYISASVTETTRFINRPTGITVCVLPVSNLYRTYRQAQQRSLRAYGGTDDKPFKDIPDDNRLRRRLLTTIKNLVKSIGTYLSTPLGSLAHELQHENCIALFCQEYEFARFDTGVLVGKQISLPVFASFQGGDTLQSILELLPRKLAFRGCTGLIIAPQQEIHRVRSHYGVPSDKIDRIFNPIDVKIWQPLDRIKARAELNIPLNAKVVINHGRIEIERKGLDILLKAWEQICRDRPAQDLRLLLIGTGSDADKLRQMIAQRQLRGVTWLDEFVNDRTTIQRYLSAADIYTLPSRLEGFPIAPTEAMACGLPIVAADASGIPDILEEGERSGGLVVPRGDANALATALRQMLDDDLWRLELGKRARRRIEEHFSMEAIGQQLYDVLMQKTRLNQSEN